MTTKPTLRDLIDPEISAISRPEGRPLHPWLRPPQIAMLTLHVLLFAVCVAILAFVGSCTFPSEGEPLVGCESCYRPPRDPGHHIGNQPLTSGESSSEDGTEDGTTEGSSSGGESSDDGAASSSEDGGSSSTGEAAWDQLHCDADCDGLDQMQDAEAGGCICAPECATDEQCPVAPTHCYYGRCVIDECAVPSDCPAVGMVCGVWSIWSICMWEDAP